MKKQNFFVKDDIELNSLWAFDYCFCGGDCINKECGRNRKSNSYKEMVKSVGYHSEADITQTCSEYEKGEQVTH